MTARLAVRTGLAVSLAAVAFLLALTHFIALTRGGALVIGGQRLAVVAAGYNRKADADLANPKRTPKDVAQSEYLSQLALNEFAYDTSAWLRIAYIDRLRHGSLTMVGVTALTRSYDLVAVDPNYGPWRVAFVLSNWDNIPKPLRKIARDEVKAFSTEGSGRVRMSRALRSVRVSDGGVMARLWDRRYVIETSRAEHKAHEKAAFGVQLLRD